MTALILPTALAPLFDVASVQSDKITASLRSDLVIKPKNLLEGFHPSPQAGPSTTCPRKRCSGRRTME